MEAYLDNAATTRIDPDVLDAMMPYLQNEYGNPGSMYSMGRRTFRAISDARVNVATMLGSSHPENIIFTSGGSESNTLAILGIADYLEKEGKKHVITSQFEHKSVLNAMKVLESRGFEVTYMSVAGGFVNCVDLTKAIRDDTGLVSIMYVNNEVGTVNPIQTIGKICEQKKILFHVDAVQAAGTYPLNPVALNCDMISVSGHKIHAPKGTGFLYTKYGHIMNPVICGGQQERGLRGGTENVAGIVGLGAACKKITEEFISQNFRTSVIMQMELTEKLQKIDGVRFNFTDHKHSSKLLSVQIKGIDAETLTMMLNERGVFVSMGSACNTGSSEPSYVLTACGLSKDEARSTIRISTSRFTTIEEIDYAAEKIAECVKMLRSIQI